MIEFTVIGKAEPAGSKRAFRNPKTGGMIVTDANQNAKPWQAAVAEKANETMLAHARGEGVAWDLLGGPLALGLCFFITRPKSHFGKRGLLPSAPEFPTGKPDALKLARAVEDALTGVVWRDDAQIVREEITKQYGDPARVEVTILELS